MTLRPPPPHGTPADVEALIRARTAAIEARNHADADRDAAHEELVTMRTDRDHWRDAASGRAKQLDEVRAGLERARRDNQALRDSFDLADADRLGLREELDTMRTARDNWRRAHEAGVDMIARVASERNDLRTELEAARKAHGDTPLVDDDGDTETDPDAVTLREYITLEVDRAIATIHDHHVHITLTAPPVTGQGWTFNTTDAGLGSVTVTDPPDRPAGDHTTAKDTNQ